MVKIYSLSHLDLSLSEDAKTYPDNEIGEKIFENDLMRATVVIWQKNFSADDFFVWYYTSNSDYLSRVPGLLELHLRMKTTDISFPMHVSKKGKDFCIADFKYFLRHATQEQVDMSLSVYGDGLYKTRRGKIRPLRVDWSKCIILWKNDFIRIGNPEIINKEDFLIRYLGIFAEGFQDEGIGVIDGYSISDYSTFKMVANEQQIQAVDAEIEKKKQHGYLPEGPWLCPSSVIE